MRQDRPFTEDQLDQLKWLLPVAIRGLDDEQRTVVKLAVVWELSEQSIAEQLGIDRDRVHRIKRTALERLYRALVSELRPA